MTDLDLPALKKLCENLTPRSQLSIVDRLETEKEFIVLGRIARTAIPKLIEEVERLREETSKRSFSGECVNCGARTKFNIVPNLNETDRLKKENAALRSLLREARDIIDKPRTADMIKSILNRIDAALGEKK